jgi:hypothetical protein
LLRSFALSGRLLARACACLALCAVCWQSAHADPGNAALAPQWKYMPAGARATYIGIHGGTVPVSLLTSRDGTHMVALVGQTGNDFLRTLKADPGTAETLPPTTSGSLPVPHDVEDTDFVHLHRQTAGIPALPPLRLAANATLLMAGTAVGAMPVIYATGHSFASLSRLYADSLLFGLSEHSPLLEGSVKAPRKTAKKARIAKLGQPQVQANSAPINDGITHDQP